MTRLLKIQIKQFGAKGEISLSFDEINLIYGKNGSGKTTVLDGIFFLFYGVYGKEFKKKKLLSFLTRYEIPLWIVGQVEKENAVYWIERKFDGKKMTSSWTKDGDKDVLSQIQKNRLDEGEFGIFFWEMDQNYFLRTCLYREHGIWMGKEEQDSYDRLLLDYFSEQSYEKYLSKVERDIDNYENPRKKSSVASAEKKMQEERQRVEQDGTKIHQYDRLKQTIEELEEKKRYFCGWKEDKRQLEQDIFELKKKSLEAQTEQIQLNENQEKYRMLLQNEEKWDLERELSFAKWERKMQKKTGKILLISIAFLVLLYKILEKILEKTIILGIKGFILYFAGSILVIGIIIAENRITIARQRKIEEKKREKEREERKSTLTDSKELDRRQRELLKRIQEYQEESISMEELIRVNQQEEEELTRRYLLAKDQYTVLLSLESKKIKNIKDYEIAKEEWNRKKEDYKIVKIAYEVLKGVHEKDRQKWIPDRWLHLNEIIRTISFGKYVKIGISESGLYFFQRQDGVCVFEEKMSYGERKILHFALRFELLFCIENSNSPIFFDDAFTHLDQEKKELLQKEICEYFGERQIFFLETEGNIPILDVKRICLRDSSF